MLPELPLESPVLIVAVAMTVFFAAPLLVRRVGVPGSVGVLLAGTALGPHGLHVLERSETIVLLGTVGLLYLMFVAALEVDISGFKKEPAQNLVFGLLSFGIPLAVGASVAAPLFDFGLSSSLLFASIFASHTILAYPTIEELGIAKNPSVNAAVSATLLSDTAALLILAWVADGHGPGSSGSSLPLLAVGLVALALSAWLLIPRLAQGFFRTFESESYFEFLFAMCVLFVWAGLGEWIGIEPLIGAFLAGLGLNRRVSTPSTLENRIDFVGSALFIPFFLFSVGMLVDPGVFVSDGDWRAWLVAGVILGVMGVSKLLAAWVAGRIYGFTGAEIGTMFSLTIGQAAAALAITLVGFEAGLFDSSVVNGVVIMVAVTAVVSPILCERFGGILVREERDRRASEEGSGRILVPILDGNTELEGLVAFAMLLQDPESEEAIRVVRVVRKEEARDEDADSEPPSPRDPSSRREGEANSDEAVARAEGDLVTAEEVAASAEVDVDTQTRVDEDPIRGVLRAIEENRITTLVTEWREPSPFTARGLGAPTDQLVERTKQLLVAIRLADPMEAMDGIVVVIPSGVVGRLAAPEALHAVRRLGAQMNAPQRYVTVGGGRARLEALLEKIPPEADAEVGEIPGAPPDSDGWRDHLDEVGAPESDDLVVVVLPRPGGRGWSPNYEAYLELPSALGAPNAALLFLAEDPSRHRVRRFMPFA